MNLPDQIPKRLFDSAQFLPEFDDNEAAWIKTDAMAVIKSLDGTNIAVSDVIILNMTPWGYIQSAPALSARRFPNEADSDYSARSRSLALDFIRDSKPADDRTLFAMKFPLWKDAA